MSATYLPERRAASDPLPRATLCIFRHPQKEGAGGAKSRESLSTRADGAACASGLPAAAACFARTRRAWPSLFLTTAAPPPRSCISARVARDSTPLETTATPRERRQIGGGGPLSQAPPRARVRQRDTRLPLVWAPTTVFRVRACVCVLCARVLPRFCPAYDVAALASRSASLKVTTNKRAFFLGLAAIEANVAATQRDIRNARVPTL